MVIRFAIIKNPNEIFGSVGRCGGGYCTQWSDWSNRGIWANYLMAKEWEKGMNKISNHYNKLEKSILKTGFKDPLVITCGEPIIKDLKFIPPWIQELPKEKWLIAEGTSGGSRLWVAQKHNLPIPCIINDSTERFKSSTKIKSIEQAKSYFSDRSIVFTIKNEALSISMPNVVKIDDEEDIQSELNISRTKLWAEVLKIYK